MADIADANPAADDSLRHRKRFLDDYRNAMTDANLKSQRAINYYNDVQLTPTQIETLSTYKNPVTISNRIKPAVNGTIGVVARGKTDPRAYPRNPQGEAAADVASDVLRYVADQNRFQRTKLKVLWDILVPGTGAALVEMDGPERIKITQIPWHEFFYDPRSRRDDFQDAMYMGIAKWMYVDQVARMYPEHAETIENAVALDSGPTIGITSQQEEDRPSSILNPWFDRKFRRLMVVEVYFQQGGQWVRSVYCGATILEEGISPYVDERKEPTNPIVAQSGYVDSQNNRYGMVQTMIPVQDVINMARQRAAHYTNMRQIQQSDPQAPPIDEATARAEARRPDGVIPPGWQVVNTQDMMSGNLALQQEAKGELERMAPIPSLVGRADQSASGRAQLVQSQAGMTEFALLFEGLTDFEYRVFGQVWMRARQFYTDPMWIRVTGEDQAPKFIQINEPVINPMTGQPEIDPTTGQPRMENHIATMDMDIIVDSVPDTANLQQEQFAQLMELLQSNPAWGQEVTFGDAVEMSSIINKRDIIKRLKERAEQNAQAQQMQQQIAAQGAQAELQKTQSETAKNVASATKTEAETVKMAMDAAMAADPRIPGGVAPPMPQQGLA